MYFLVISAAVTMFGVQFFFNERYTRAEGAGIRAVLRFSLCANAAGAVILSAVALVQNGFRPEVPALFTLGVAAAAAVNGITYIVCSCRALTKINLSLYSVFSMLGGMALPFISGFLFFQETVTPGKLVCFLFVSVALAFTVRKDDRRGGWIYYLGIFFCNGMSGVLTKTYQYLDVPKNSDAVYSATLACLMAAAAGAGFLLSPKDIKRCAPRSIGFSVGYGVLSTVANFFLLLSLSHIPASAQYPFVTGGVMIVSTLLCYCTPNRPQKKDLAAVVLAFAGLLALMIFE